jgi:heat shock protein HslJ
MSPRLQDLEGVEWKLQGFEPEVDLEIPEEVSITMEFSGGVRVAGSAGCNRYFSSYKLDGNSLELSETGSTMMMCPPEIMELEQKFLGALQKVTEIELESGQLLLTKDGEVLLRLERSIKTEE